MGRYYDGDIEGKFWFAVQSSNAPERFGAQEFEPSHINYYFDEEQLKMLGGCYNIGVAQQAPLAGLNYKGYMKKGQHT